MAKRVELEGLTPQEARAAAFRAQGLSQAEAYRRAFDVKRAKPKTVWEKSSRLFAKTAVQARVRELLRAAKIEDIDSVAEAHDDLLRLLHKAEMEGNYTAAAQLSRIRMQALGALRDNVALTMEQRCSDEDLIGRIAGGDSDLAEVLRRRMGREGFDS